MIKILYYANDDISSSPIKGEKNIVIKKPMSTKLSDLQIADFLDAFATIVNSNINFKTYLIHTIPSETNKKLKWVLASIYYYLDKESLDFAQAIEKLKLFLHF